MTALPSTRQAGAVRPMQAAYRRHIKTCWWLNEIGLTCHDCDDLYRAADIEAGQGPRGFAPDLRDWDGWL